ncbi:MAG: sugar-binding transcriptional regulator [Fimbriimonadaceae bacterium]|nr:sugar-binding transcriptional regulator [Fimbriimonadaceae bacterium]MBX3103489.1 sugar-binding transcriptional regulator [Cryobacterium sp.]MCC6376534.1 sugar-binding transcriptional regulator [Microbacteriaceae bacterium]
MATSVSEDTELLTVRVAELYYDEDKTQDQIGALLGITRWKVGRLLARGRERGIVRIEIVHPRARRLGIERELRDKFGLKDAVVVPVAENIRARVAQAAADYLTALRPVPRTLGISWGRTMDDVAHHLPMAWANGVTVVQINGGVSLNKRPGTASTTAAEIARKGRGQAILLPSPAILERIETKRAIVGDRTVAAVLDRAKRSDVFLYSAGVADGTSVLVDTGYLAKDTITELVRRGAVGDVLGRYIDSNGNPVDPGLDDRTVGLDLKDLRRASSSILVVAGEAKHPVARAVVTSQLCSVIVTDEDTATMLLGEE